MFKFLDVDRPVLTLITTALAIGVTLLVAPAEEAVAADQPLGTVFPIDPFADPDEDEPDPYPLNLAPQKSESDPFLRGLLDPDEDEPDPYPLSALDPDEDEPDPYPIKAESYPLVLSAATALRFQVDGAAMVAVHDAAGHRLFGIGDGTGVVMTLAAGEYELRVEGRADDLGAVQLHLEYVPHL